MGLIPFVAFWVLVITGLYLRELGPKAGVTLIVIWLAGWWGIPLVGLHPAWFVILVVALDVGLVLRIFHGDIRIK